MKNPLRGRITQPLREDVRGKAGVDGDNDWINQSLIDNPIQRGDMYRIANREISLGYAVGESSEVCKTLEAVRDG